MKRIYLIVVLVVLALGAGVYFIFLNGDDESTDSSLTQALPVDGEASTSIGEVEFDENDPTVSGLNDELEEAEAPEGVASFDLSMSNYEFSSTVLNVRPGDEVTIFLQSEEGTHDFVIDDFGVQSQVLNAGENQEFTFTVPIDASGSYEFYCSVGNHKALGMVGQLVVGE